MPTAITTPEALKPYFALGLQLSLQSGEDQATSYCPFCGREEKLSINVETGKWRCFVCAEGNEKGGGNAITFLEKVWEHSTNSTEVFDDLANDRGIEPDTLRAWGVCRSILTGEWLVPGFNPSGKLRQLYRYRRTPKGMRLLPTPTMKHQLHGVNLYDPSKPFVHVCEGPWDGMAWWETMARAKPSESGFIPTSSDSSCLLALTNVLAVPGCGTFDESWAPLLSEKQVTFLYDSDHPREHPITGKVIPPAGVTGVRRVVGILSQGKKPPESISYLAWGESGYDRSLPSGYDLRDLLRGKGDNGETPPGRPLGARIGALGRALGMVSPVPKEWLKRRPGPSVNGKGGKGSSDELQCLDCTKWQTLVASWRKAVKWTTGLDRALSIMLASITSTMAVGDQLWVKVIGPASCGKSTLCEAVSVCTDYIVAKSTIRGFHSGFKTEAGEDHSLVSRLFGKTLVTKDGDTLLQSPNLGQILAEARDLYDSTSRTHYRNSMSKDYSGVRMTWLLCGTNSLRSIDSSELGERFLDCVIMEGIDEDLEDEILWRVANRAERNVSTKANSSPETHYDPALSTAMQLTGGYTKYLRENASELLAEVTTPEKALRQCTRLGKFVAFMRARPSQRQEETAERELAARLVSQMTRLAKCLAVVLNRKTVDEEVMSRVRLVALDTGRGQTLEITRIIYEYDDEGIEPRTLVLDAGMEESKLRALVRFLIRIGVVEQFFPQKAKGVKGRLRWKLTPSMRRLYEDVIVPMFD